MGLLGLIEDFDISQYLTDDDDIEAFKDELIEKYDSSPKMARVNIIRKGSALMCASTPKFKILDITNYLAPCFYSAYLKAFYRQVNNRNLLHSNLFHSKRKST